MIFKSIKVAHKYLFSIFILSNLILLLYSVTHSHPLIETPDSIICYEFESSEGEHFLIKYEDWQILIPEHLKKGTFDNNIVEKICKLNKTRSKKALYLIFTNMYH